MYHGDADGAMSAASILHLYQKAYPNEHLPAFTLWCMKQYGQHIDIDKAATFDRVYMVDYSANTDVMFKLLESCKNFIWIDHHETAINKFTKEEHEKIQGIRYFNPDYPLAGCELTYAYMKSIINGGILDYNVLYSSIDKNDKSFKFSSPFYNIFVDYVGAYDTWRYTNLDPQYAKECKMARYVFGDMEPMDMFKLLERTEGVQLQELLSEINNILSMGEVIERYIVRQYSEKCEMYAREVEFEGFKCLVANTTESTSLFFGERIKEYDVCAVYRQTAEGTWAYSLYSDASRNVAVNNIALKYGGGGHPGAAGFTIDKLLF